MNLFIEQLFFLCYFIGWYVK